MKIAWQKFFLAASVLGLGFIVVCVPTLHGQIPAKLPVVDALKHKNYTDKILGKVSFDMVAVPGGTYLMGSPAGEAGRAEHEGPQHAVTVKPFWMGKYEVRWDEYDWFWMRRFPGGQPPPRPDISKKPTKLPDAITSPTPPYSDETFGHGRDNNPVIAVTYHAAMEYCRWLSKETGKHYRLPTEAEWEWACRAGTTGKYSFGDDAGKLGDYAWYEKNADELVHKVGEKKPNPWGLYDMHGNVSEFCIDFYDKGFYATLPAGKISLNPFNPPKDKRYPYVARGGSWIDGPENCRSAFRRASERSWLKRDPQNPQSIWWMTDAQHVGFRIVCAVEEDERLKNIRSPINWWSED